MLSSLTTHTSVQAHVLPLSDSNRLSICSYRDKPLPFRLPSLSKLVGLNTGNRGRKLANPLVEPSA